jgi:hypothetical protein
MSEGTASDMSSSEVGGVLHMINHTPRAVVKDQNVSASVIEIAWNWWLTKPWFNKLFNLGNQVVRNVDVVSIGLWLKSASDLLNGLKQIIEERNSSFANYKDVHGLSFIILKDLLCHLINSFLNSFIFNENCVNQIKFTRSHGVLKSQCGFVFTSVSVCQSWWCTSRCHGLLHAHADF